MGIFNINYKTLFSQILPPILRQPIQAAYDTALMYPFDYNDGIFGDYRTGCSYSLYNSGTTYTSGTRVIWIDNTVYQSISGSTGQLPSTGTSFWYQINNSFIGATERSQMCCPVLTFDYALNRNFQLSGFCPTVLYSAITQSLFAQSANTIYIQQNVVLPNVFVMGQTGPYSSYMSNNSAYQITFMCNNFSGFSNNDFTIWYPSGNTSLSATKITSFANTLNLGGIQFNVASY
jgi:hypothetical protein